MGRLALADLAPLPDRPFVPPWEVERTAAAARYQLERLGADVGRLRRRLVEPGYDRDLLAAVASRVEVLLIIFGETAAELIHDGVDVDRAILEVERRARAVRLLLGDDLPW